MTGESNQSQQSDLHQRLEEWPDDPPRDWQANVGQIVEGEVVQYRKVQGRFGQRWVCDVREQSGELISIWLSATVLQNEFERQRPRPGETIGIRRLADAGKGYKRFVLLVEGREDSEDVPDFDQTTTDADAPADAPSQSATDETLADFSNEALSEEDDLPF